MRALVTLVLSVLATGCCCRRPCCPASVPAAPAAPAAPAPVAASPAHVVEIYAVADLVHAVGALEGLVDVGSPEEAPSERLLQTLALSVPLQTVLADPGAVAEMRYTNGERSLVVKATPSEQAGIAQLLAAWRESWKARWPEAFPAQ